MKFHRFGTLGSTNDHLAAMAEAGIEEGTVVMADRQSAGRGRGGSHWWSPEGNLHMSALLRPEIPPRELLRLPVIAALAFVSAVGEAGSPLVLKWPNDVLLEGRKMAGILAESRSEGDRVLWAVVGFGVNMTPPAGKLPEELENRIAFLSELDGNIKRDELAAGIASHLIRLSKSLLGEGWPQAQRLWTRRALLGTPYTFKDGGRRFQGIPLGLDGIGGLVMRTEDGVITVYSGELEKG